MHNPELTDDERQLLIELDAYERNMRDLGLEWKWARPLDVGGHNGSRHSYLLGRLVQHGYAEDRQRSPVNGRRGSKVYHTTEAGRALLSELAPR